jgi:hypothetical protein
VATYNKELARKIIRLLESDHDGEVLSAVNKLRVAARGQRQNLDEMLATIYGSAAPKAAPSPVWEAPPKQHPRYSDEKLQELREAYDKYGAVPLTAWETPFVEDILDRWSDVLSDKQADVIDKILARYKSFAARNGDEKSFWGA